MSFEREAPTECTECGYDLRGAVAREGFLRCPECGVRQEPRRLVELTLTWGQFAAWMAAPVLVLPLGLAAGLLFPVLAHGAFVVYLFLAGLWLLMAWRLAGAVVSEKDAGRRMARAIGIWALICGVPAVLVLVILNGVR